MESLGKMGEEPISKVASYISIFFLVLVLLAILFETGLLVYAYFHADKVKCNLLWCEFTTVRSQGKCTQNGISINCSEMPDIDKIIKEAGFE